MSAHQYIHDDVATWKTGEILANNFTPAALGCFQRVQVFTAQEAQNVDVNVVLREHLLSE